jgi:CBS domain-containing protein/GGDEF domain-containing protein
MMDPRPLNVVLVTPDRAAMRHATRLMTVFGYQVRGVTEIERAAELISAERPNILIIDAAGGLEPAIELCRSASADSTSGYLYKMLMVREPKHTQLMEAIEAGADDFLASPLEHGELLARLRTAARVLEFERRVENQSPPEAGCLPKAAFLARMDAVLQSDAGPVQCLAFELDHCRELESVRGRPLVAEAMAKIGSLIGARSGPAVAYAHAGRHGFHVAVSSSLDEAIQWADQLREQIAGAMFAADKSATVTVSCGVSSATGAASTSELIEQAGRALVQAQQSGGDLVVACDQFADEEQKWAEVGAQGTLFEKTLARDIMVPAATCLHVQDDAFKARMMFRQTRLRALPVVDDEGKLGGLLASSSVQSRPVERDGSPSKIARLMTTDVVSFDEQTTLEALIDYFRQESPLVIVIVNKGRPTGLVTPSSLATLSEQLTSATFAPTEEALGTASLVVPNLCGVDDE